MYFNSEISARNVCSHLLKHNSLGNSHVSQGWSCYLLPQAVYPKTQYLKQRSCLNAPEFAGQKFREILGRRLVSDPAWPHLGCVGQEEPCEKIPSVTYPALQCYLALLSTWHLTLQVRCLGLGFPQPGGLMKDALFVQSWLVRGRQQKLPGPLRLLSRTGTTSTIFSGSKQSQSCLDSRERRKNSVS